MALALLNIDMLPLVIKLFLKDISKPLEDTGSAQLLHFASSKGFFAPSLLLLVSKNPSTSRIIVLDPAIICAKPEGSSKSGLQFASFGRSSRKDMAALLFVGSFVNLK